MIRLVRRPEPADLQPVRDNCLERLRALIQRENRDPTSTEITGYGLPSVRKALFDGQSSKCCYCEDHIEPRFDPVEHYRPKSEAAKDGLTPKRSGYWWLAYSWDNLLYSCGICNGEKGTKFPLAAGSTPLRAEQQPPGGEEPFLLNPYARDSAPDPVELIEFRKTASREKDTWQAFARHGDERARKTIEDIVKLNRDGLVKPYRDHVNTAVMPKVEAVKLALRGEDLRNGDLLPLWRAYWVAVRSLLRARSRFAGLSYDALRHFVPDGQLMAHLRRGWPIPPAAP